jgi:NADPH-dependent curcumin reductase CurA
MSEPAVTRENFRLEEVPLPELPQGGLLLRVLYLSLDPYMRGRMDDRKSYAKPVRLGEVMTGESVCEVIASDQAGYAVGDIVLAQGSLVGQLAKLAGARAVGIAGGPKKCRPVVEEFRFDAAADHRVPDFAEKLAAACPNGIDVYFENVGGAIWHAVLPLLNTFARVPVCGLIAQYNATGPAPGPNLLPATMREVLSKSLTLRGYINYEFAADHYAAFLRTVGTAVTDGRIRYREDITDGLENAPAAFIDMLESRNFGKALMRVTPSA